MTPTLALESRGVAIDGLLGGGRLIFTQLSVPETRCTVAAAGSSHDDSNSELVGIKDITVGLADIVDVVEVRLSVGACAVWASALRLCLAAAFAGACAGVAAALRPPAIAPLSKSGVKAGQVCPFS